MGDINEAKNQRQDSRATKDNNTNIATKMKRNFQLLLRAGSIFFPPLRWPYRIEKGANGDFRIIDKDGNEVGRGMGF